MFVLTPSTLQRCFPAKEVSAARRIALVGATSMIDASCSSEGAGELPRPVSPPNWRSHSTCKPFQPPSACTVRCASASQM